MADLGFLPAVRRLLDRTPQQRPAAAVLGHARQGVNVLVKRFLHQPGHPRGRLGAVAGRRRWTTTCCTSTASTGVPVLVDLTSAPGRTVVFTRTKHGAKALARQLNRSGVPDRRAARQPRPERPHPQHGGVPLRQGHHAGRHRHRRPRHPRRRRRARRARRPAGRAQGLPAPLGPYGARRRRRHRRHADDRRAGRATSAT